MFTGKATNIYKNTKTYTTFKEIVTTIKKIHDINSLQI